MLKKISQNKRHVLMKEKAADVLIYSGFGERRAQYELSYRRHKAFRISINTETGPLKKKGFN